MLSSAARRRQKKLREFGWQVLKLAAGVVILAATAFAAFEAGSARNEESVKRIRADLAALDNNNLELIAAKETAEERVRRMAAALAQLERDYEENVPDGTLAGLLGLIKNRLSEGISPERLRFILETVRQERKCDKSTESRPILVRTPLSTTIENTVGFADNKVVVSAEGESAKGEDIEFPPLFDPSQDVVMRFLMVSGEIETVRDRLPVNHSVVLDDNEYQFQIIKDDRRGYVSVTLRRCDYI